MYVEKICANFYRQSVTNLLSKLENDMVCHGLNLGSERNQASAPHKTHILMKKISSGLLLSVSFLAAPAYAIDFWHSNTVWSGQGQCSAVFTFDSGLEDIKKLQVSVSAINRSGKRVASGVLEVPQFGQSSATRYAEAYLEGEDLCDDDLTITVTKASAMIDGKRTDLVKSRVFVARDFKSYKIKIQK